MNGIKFEIIARYLCRKYGSSVVGRLKNKNGNVVPKCYVHYATNTIYTRDPKKANKYVYFEID